MATLTPIQAATQLLLHFDGNFADTGARKTNAITVSAGGGGVISSGPSKFGTTAYDLNAPSTVYGTVWNGLVVPSWDVPQSYEGFFYLRAANNRFLMRAAVSLDCFIDSSSFINARFFDSAGVNQRVMMSNTAIALNTWVHIRIVLIPNRYENSKPTRLLFIDGVLHDSSNDFTGSGAPPIATNASISVGHNFGTASTAMDGRVNEFRYVSGALVDDFSRIDPPTAALPDTAGTDPQYSSTVLHLHCDGSNGGTTFTDNSGYARAPTTVTGTVTTVTSDKVLGSASIRFNNGGLTYTSSDFDSMATGDFEIEFFCKTYVAGSTPIINLWTSATNYIQLGFENGPILTWYRNTPGANNVAGGGAFGYIRGISFDTWYHIRLVRIGTNALVWVDGVLLTCFKHGLAAGSLSITLGQFNFIGGLDELRVTKLVRSAVNFTPPTSKYSDVPTADAQPIKPPFDLLNAYTKARTPSYKSVTPALFLKDTNYGGKGRITGTVKVKGSPSYAVKREVRLIRDKDGACIRSTWSDPATGAYEFRYVDETQRYTILTYDYTHDKRAVVADNIQPELM